MGQARRKSQARSDSGLSVARKRVLATVFPPAMASRVSATIAAEEGRVPGSLDIRRSTKLLKGAGTSCLMDRKGVGSVKATALNTPIAVALSKARLPDAIS